ncbi:MAG: DUF4112 domain-containing protein, partial [Acidimicrobiia bacterium]
GINVSVDYLIGLIPFAGDAGDVLIKSNRWNLALLKRYAGGEERPGIRETALVILIVAGVLGVMAGGLALMALVLHGLWNSIP